MTIIRRDVIPYLIDCLIVSLVYALGQIALLEGNRPTDVSDFARSLFWGSLFRSVPPALTWLVMIRQRYGVREPMIGG